MFRYNLLFFVSGGGKFNYQGTKRWLEDNLDHTGSAQSRLFVFMRVGGAIYERVLSSVDYSLLHDNVAFVLCLDTVGNGDALHLHVSKPPKEGTPQNALLKELESVRRATHTDLKCGAVHLNTHSQCRKCCPRHLVQSQSFF